MDFSQVDSKTRNERNLHFHLQTYGRELPVVTVSMNYQGYGLSSCKGQLRAYCKLKRSGEAAIAPCQFWTVGRCEVGSR